MEEKKSFFYIYLPISILQETKTTLEYDSDFMLMKGKFHAYIIRIL